jgi:hypothetical protein
MNLKAFVIVQMDTDVVNDVKLFIGDVEKNKAEAEAAFFEWTGVNYQEYKNRLAGEEDDIAILGDKAGTQIREASLNGNIDELTLILKESIQLTAQKRSETAAAATK